MRFRGQCSFAAGLAVGLAATTASCGGDDSRESATIWMPSTTAAATSDESSTAGSADTGASAPTTTFDPTDASSSSASAGTETTSPTTTDPTADGTATTAGESTGGASVCDGIAGEELVPPSLCDGPSGNTSTEVPTNGLFSTSWFGCYLGTDGEIVQDPSDNCEFACGPQGLCDDAQSGPECEAGLQWFAADADRYGCGGRIRVTNCENGNAVVLVTLDRGPNCGVEMDCETPVLDMSHDAMVYLFDGGEYGGCDHQVVVVEAVDDATPLGPV